jgi:hypothetical protein
LQEKDEAVTVRRFGYMLIWSFLLDVVQVRRSAMMFFVCIGIP